VEIQPDIHFLVAFSRNGYLSNIDKYLIYRFHEERIPQTSVMENKNQ
jgi:hypothetical protein